MKLVTIRSSVISLSYHHFIWVLGLTLLGLIAVEPSLAQQSQWQRAVSNTTNTLVDVSYNNGQWVAVGFNGTIVTSSDGINWIPRTSNTVQRLNAVSYGADQWIVVGNNGTVLNSADGISWTPQSATTTQNYSSAAYGAGLWVVTSDKGIITSPDGIYWTHQNTKVAYGVSYGAGVFVGVGENRGIISSPDGIIWTNRFANLPGAGLCRCLYPTLYDVLFGDGKFVVIGGIGGGGAAATSPDGITWTVGNAPYQATNIGYGAGLWLTFVYNGIIQTSTDGLSWSLRFHPDRRQYLYKANYGAGLWVAVGEQGQIQYTTNANAPLPVSLLSFTGQAEDPNAHLNWETSWEKGASHFLVERSIDAKSFEAVGRISALGTTSTNQHYSFVDKDLASNLWYYRLRQVDLDGTYTHSQIIAVRIGTEPLETLTLSPNPSSGPMLIEYKKGIQSVRIYSVTGTLIEQHEFAQAVDRWSWAASGQPAGVYIIEAKTQDSKSASLRWIKQ